MGKLGEITPHGSPIVDAAAAREKKASRRRNRLLAVLSQPKVTRKKSATLAGGVVPYAAARCLGCPVRRCRLRGCRVVVLFLRRCSAVAAVPVCGFARVCGGCRACPLWGHVCFGLRSLVVSPFVAPGWRVRSVLPPVSRSWVAAVSSARRAGVRVCLLSCSLPRASVVRAGFALGLLPLRR